VFLEWVRRQEPAGILRRQIAKRHPGRRIANGITGQATDGSGIQWTSGNSCGEDWRWVEQWLPHAAWYMVAIAALAQ